MAKHALREMGTASALESFGELDASTALSQVMNLLAVYSRSSSSSNASNAARSRARRARRAAYTSSALRR